ncbi:hypothetical protein [Burkholderia stagnalis]|uniref:hypothetical protein n=1 Tax=Burkholderia stagnalis TaxID=1503054 RepID=UPI000A81D81E|nr:hypothetical protein [Burkholderia stagnalis]
MKTWNERLAKALAESEEYHGNVNRFAGDVGVAAPSVAAWIGAGTIKPAKDIRAIYLIKACSLLHVTPEWVLFGSGKKSTVAPHESTIVNPKPNVTDETKSPEISKLISRLQNLHTEVSDLLSYVKGLPSVSAESKHSQDMDISSVRAKGAAAADLLREGRSEGGQHGKHKNR